MFILKIIILVISAAAMIAYLSEFVRMYKNGRKKEKAREERAAHKLKDRRDNMGGRVYNALAMAVRGNPIGQILVERLNRDDAYWILINRQIVGRRYTTVMRVSITLSGSGFEVAVDDGSPSRYAGPEAWFVEKVIPGLVERTKTFGIK